MAALKILRPPVCGDSAREVPRAQWSMLIKERVNFCKNVLPSDCRLLLFFVEDAEKSGWMGFENRDGYLRDGLHLEPEMVELALRGLELSDPNKPLGYDRARVLGKQGRPKNEDNKPCAVTRLNYGTAEHWEARLRRDDPTLAARVQAGDISADAAAKQKGWRKPRKRLSNFEQIVRWVPKLTDDERRQLRAMLGRDDA
jgi:hypothetical protein